MSLISQDQFDEINKAFRSVTDTFFTSDCVYLKYAKPLGEWNEGGQDEEYEQILLKCRVEDTPANQSMDEKGGIHEETIEVSFNFDYLKENEMVDENERALFQADKDHLVWRGLRYKIHQVKHDGLLNDKHTLVVLMCQRDEY